MKEKGFCCSLIETNSIIGGPAEKCCRQCRYHPRKKRCVSLRTGRCCPCSTRCRKRSSPTKSTTTTTTTSTTTTTAATTTTTKTSTTTTTSTTRHLISAVVDDTPINPTF